MNDTEARELSLALFRKATPVSADAPIEDWRRGFEAMADAIGVPENLDVEEVNAGGVPCLLVRASGASRERLVVHFHSGGYVMGSPRAYREFANRLSGATKATVLLPDYRLAPENPFPAPVEDALLVYRWCLGRYALKNLILSGDSAGGGLCIATLLNIRDNGLPNPAGAFAISPLLDLAGEGGSANIESDALINRDLIVGMGKVYIGDIDPHQEPLASPLWGRHHGLPPIHLVASASEALRDDSVRFAESVRQARGEVSLSLHDGLVHIWTFFPFLNASAVAMEEIGRFCEGAWAASADG